MERGLTGLTGYGPSNLTFDGNDERYELWEVKFRAYLDLKSLNSVLEGEESSLDVETNKQVFSELVQRLDDKSLSLIIRDAYGDGRKSMKILRDHYLGSSKPRIISLYCELAALKMQNGETATDYLLRAETTASYLKRAGEMISDGLIIAMIIRGLPAAYNAFSTVVTQRDSAEMDFQKFKSALKSEEETKKTGQSHSENEDRVMKVKDSKIICYLCGKSGHKKVECKNYSAKKNRWCSICKSASHDTKFCRKKDTVKAKATDSKDVKGSFCFRVTTDSESASVVDSANLLVDCGATAHIICDKSKFVSLDKNFDPSKHFIELADGSRMNNIVDAKAFKKFLADSAPFGSVKRLRTDNGTEYSSRLFKAVVMDNKIKHEFTAPYSPHQNGTAERSWRSLFEMARCLLLHANLPKELWNHAVRTAAHIRNRCFNKRTGKTPFEMFTRKKPDLSNMHIFGSKCFSKSQNPGKLDPRNVMIEDEFIAVDNPAELKQSGKTDEAEAELKPGTVPEGIQNETHLDEKPTRRFPLREKKPPIYLKDYVDPDECDITNHVVDYYYRVSSILKSYSEAISSPDSVEWQKAISDEMAALVDNETFERVAKPKERSVIGGRWVYSVKSGPNDQEIFKARYVAKGYSQVADVDFTETFSPTARLTSVRMLMDIAVQKSYIVLQMDVCTAYLHAKIDCNVFVEQPEGFIELDKN
ncbi:Reverse transcriptase RNA-dependent DNA polymerase [Trinorchestia longiramus]|nr:Reverse transcriptase RNA-dependent DNA polymerase [Trinorchestia longiramus]